MKTQDMLELLVQLTTPAWKWAVGVGVGLVSFALPDKGQVDMALFALALVGADTVTGIMAAAKTGKPIQSAKLGRFFTKIVVYFTVIVVAAGIRKYVTGGQGVGQFSQAVVLTMVVLRESLSVLENVNRMGFTLFKPLESILKGRLAEATDKAKEPAP